MNSTVTAATRLVLRACASILPAGMRQEWVNEWVGEIAEARRTSRGWGWWTELRLLPGAAGDALTTRRLRWELNAMRKGRAMGAMGSGFDGWRTDLDQAVRRLRARPGLTLVVTLTLAMGAGATTAVFSAVNSVLLRELPYGRSERVVVVRQTDTRDGSLSEGVSAANLEDVGTASLTLTDVGMADGLHGLRLARDGRAESLRTWLVSDGFFQALSARPAVGRLFTPDEYVPDGEKVVVLSYGTWQARFSGDRRVIGREVVLDDVAHRVVGVLAEDFRYPSAAEAWTPRASRAGDDQRRGRVSMRGVARLEPGVDLAEAQSELDRIGRELARTYPATNAYSGFQLIPLRDELLGDVESPLTLLMGAVLLVLMIASANVAGLQYARNASRAHDDAVRVALGATVGRVARMLLAESLILALLGGLGGVAIAYLGIDMIQMLGPAHLPRIDELRIDRTVLGFALLVSLVSALAAGIAPALRSSGTDVRSVLGDGGRGKTGGPGSGPLRERLVVGQIALALVLSFGAGLLLLSLDRVLGNDLGFDPDGLVAAQVWAYNDRHEAEFGYFERGAQALRALPGVESVGITSNLPLADGESLLARPLPVPFVVAQRPSGSNGQEYFAALSIIDAMYPVTMGIGLVSGRGFTSGDDHRSSPVAMVNEAFVRRYFPDDNPLGAQLIIAFRDGRSPEIVGVLRDVRGQGLESEATPELYMPLAQERFNGLTFVIRTRGDAAAIVGAVREALWDTDASQAIWANRPVTDLLSESTRHRTFNTVLLTAFATLALALSAIGVYALMSFSVAERGDEFGARRGRRAPGVHRSTRAESTDRGDVVRRRAVRSGDLRGSHSRGDLRSGRGRAAPRLPSDQGRPDGRAVRYQAIGGSSTANHHRPRTASVTAFSEAPPAWTGGFRRGIATTTRRGARLLRVRARPVLCALLLKRPDAVPARHLEWSLGSRIVGESVECRPFDPRADGTLDPPEVVLLLRRDEREGFAGQLRAGGPPDPVDVIIRHGRHIEVHHVTERFDVDAAGGDVGRDEHSEVPSLETRERLRALRLGAIPVDSFRGDAVAEEELREPVRAVLRAREDQRLVHPAALEELDEQRSLQRRGDGIGELCHACGGCGLSLKGDLGRAIQDLAGQLLDLRRHRRAEEERLLRLRNVAEDTPDVGQEAHVEHSVGLVQDEALEPVESCVVVLEVVEKPAGRRDDHVGAFAERFLLGPHLHAAVHGGGREARVSGQIRQVPHDLEGQLTRRREHQRAGRAPGPVDEPMENRQQERGRLPASGGRAGKEVTPFESGRDGFVLNGCGPGKTQRVDPFEQGRVQLQCGERQDVFLNGRRLAGRPSKMWRLE